MEDEDSELILMAAKAVGLKIQYSNNVGGFSIGEPYSIGEREWNPLHDNSDALCLALKLGLCIQPIPECDTVQVYQMHSFTGEPFNVHTAANGDIELRIIIVQAAAEIGRAMP